MSALVQRAFAGGEIDPALGMRADMVKYATGLRTCRNFEVQRQGGVTNRPGTYKTAETKLSGASSSALKRFVFQAADESYLIECGDLYLRFYWHGAPVLVSGVAAYNGATAYVQGDLVVSGGVNYYAIAPGTGNAPPNITYWYPLTGNIYELPTPYTAGVFKAPNRACFAQSGDVITITHLNFAPRELRRYSRTRWTLTPITTSQPVAAPTNLAMTPGTPAPVARPNGEYVGYVVTALIAGAGNESVASNAVTQDQVGKATTVAGNVLTWDAVGGALAYNVYKDGTGDGVYGFIFQSAAPPFTDYGFEANYSHLPPVARTLFDAANKYPACAVTYQQRRVFGGTHTDREQIEASVVAAPSRFGIHFPLQDDDSVSFKLAGNEVNPVLHMLALRRLIMLTDASVWAINGDDSQAGAITPTAINPEQHSYVGAADVPPVTIGDAILFVQLQNKVLRDLRYTQGQQGESLLGGRDLSVLAAHLTKASGITDLAFAANPHSIVWAVRADGALLGLTYLPEEEVWGWHRHDTDGVFESIAVVPESGEDVVYAIVKRTINGTVRRFVERFASREFTDVKEACFVDCAVRVANSAPTATITGLAHLEGKTVAVLADGAVPSTPTYTVAGGQITLSAAATIVQVGLPITADLELLDLDVSGSSLRARTKRVVNLQLLVQDSMLGFQVGPDATHLVPLNAAQWQTTTTAVVSEMVEVNPTSAYTASGRLLLRHTNPTPLTVLGALPTIEPGG